MIIFDKYLKQNSSSYMHSEPITKLESQFFLQNPVDRPRDCMKFNIIVQSGYKITLLLFLLSRLQREGKLGLVHGRRRGNQNDACCDSRDSTSDTTEY